jgi:hypothetical protein
MQLSVLAGIYTDEKSDFRVALPRNYVPVAQKTGISEGYIRPGDGIVSLGTGPGIDRGGIEWNGVMYRVMGTKLVRINSNWTVTELGDVGGSGQVTFDYSFDYLAVASSGNLYLWNGAALQQVTDSDLGTVLDFVWVDGYFMTTDGEFLIVTELNNPFSVDPLKYGSSEFNPDPIKALLKLRNEVYALNRYSIEVFDNVGGTNFPFQRIDGAVIEKGVIGTHACCEFMQTIAFLGGGHNEQPAVWLGNNATARKISTREIDLILLEYTEEQLSSVLLENRVSEGHQSLYVHLPDKTLVFDFSISEAANQSIWYVLTSSLVGDAQYRARNLVWAYGKTIVGDPQSSSFGYLSNSVSTHWGQRIGWIFGTSIVYNEGRGVLFNELELVALTGRAEFGVDPTIWTQYTLDGVTWSQEKPISAGLRGDRLKRLCWFRQGSMRNWRAQRFRGTSDAHMSVTRLEVKLEPLAV